MNYETPLSSRLGPLWSSSYDGLKLMIDLIDQVEGGAIWRNGGLPASCSLRSGLEVSRELIVLLRLSDASLSSKQLNSYSFRKIVCDIYPTPLHPLVDSSVDF